MIEVRFHQKAILKNSAGYILAIKRSYGNKKWDIAGGAVELPELHEAALRRECREETGLEIENIRPVDVQTAINDEDGAYMLFIGYVCTALGDSVVLSGEHGEWKWVTKEGFEELEATPYIKDFVKKFA